MAKRLPKDKINKQAQSLGKLSPIEEKVFSLCGAMGGGSADNENPFVTLKYFSHSFECFSAWEKEELKCFSDFLSSLRQRTWRQVLETSGKAGSKVGLGYTAYDLSTVKTSAEEHLRKARSEIGDDITFFELRLNQKMRVHGFRAKAAFFLVLLDREHRVFPA